MSENQTASVADLSLVRDLRRDLAAAADGLEHAARFALPITASELRVVGIDSARRRQAHREDHLAAARHSLESAEFEVDRALVTRHLRPDLASIVQADIRRAALHEAAALRQAA